MRRCGPSGVRAIQRRLSAASLLAAVAGVAALAGCAGPAPAHHRHHRATASAAHPTLTASPSRTHRRPTPSGQRPTSRPTRRSHPTRSPRPTATHRVSTPRPTRRPSPTRSAPHPTVPARTPRRSVRIPTPGPTRSPARPPRTPTPTPIPVGFHVSGDLLGLLTGRAACSAGGHTLRFQGLLGGHPATLEVVGARPGATVHLPETPGGVRTTATLLATPPHRHRSEWVAGSPQAPGSGMVVESRTGRSGSLSLYLDATGGNSVAVELSGAWSCG